MLLAHVLGVDRQALWTMSEVPAGAAQALDALVERRVAEATPVAYLVGQRGFHELDLEVDGRVLVPRPETELLVERLLSRALAGELPAGPLLDWGTGSGCVALSLAAVRPVLALDRSAEALAVATANRRTVGPRHEVLCVQADGLSALGPACLAAIAANPPYVTADEWQGLDPDVRDHEPRAALVPADGDVPRLYRRLGEQARACLVPGGWLAAEVGAGQARWVADLWRAAGLEVTAVLADLSGIERVVEARLPS